MGLANFNTSISQIHNYSTSTTLISLPPYLKTIIKHQTFLSIQHTHKNFYKSFMLSVGDVATGRKPARQSRVSFINSSKVLKPKRLLEAQDHCRFIHCN